MANKCLITGKHTIVGHNVSHSNRRTKRQFKSNLQTKRMVNPATGKLVRVTVSTRGLRTIKKWIEAGKKVDLAEMKNELEKI